MNRRTFLKKAGMIGVGASLAPFSAAFGSGGPASKKVLVLGIDGMDVHITRQYMRQGLLPNFSKLAAAGGMTSAATSMPPQSPVAWSDFAVGASAAVHGVYDFIHRDPETMAPYLSTSRVNAPETSLSLGDWDIPLGGAKVEQLRQGRPFWEYLADRDIPTTIFKMPANFPCEGEGVNMISGMGTPDLRGGYGSSTFFTTSPAENMKNISGGAVVEIGFDNDRAETRLPGPRNTLKKGRPEVGVPMEIWRDRTNPVARVKIQDVDLLLNQGEWTDWIALSFPMIPHVHDVKGICKLYLKSVHPEFQLYVSPLNIDPADPVLPIFTPEGYGRDLVRNVGRFFTQGLPDDTKALSNGILTEDEYLNLALQVLDERKRMLDFELRRFDRLGSGMLFFYISSLDQNTHMYWRAIDPRHPMYNEDLHRKYGNELKKLYVEMDRILGDVLSRFDAADPANTLIVMSDHGFAPFRRQVNVNTWLHENGYLALSDPNDLENRDYFGNVDWTGTAAYSLGVNGLYVNREGREKRGAVAGSQTRRVIRSLTGALLAMSDPDTGEPVVSDVRITPETDFRSHPNAPDMIIGWKRGYRTSWESILGGFAPEIIRDNDDKWSGDHCIDPRWVPAILFSNRTIVKKDPAIHDVTATILSEFGLSTPTDMEGRSLFDPA